jgi:AraC-like DNA-binding protein
MEPTMITRERQVLSGDALTLPGLKLLGHLVSSRASRPLEVHIHPGCMEFVVVCRGVEHYHVAEERHELTGYDVFVSFVDQPHSTGGAPQGVSEIIWFQIDPGAAQLLGLSARRAAALRAQLLALKGHRLRTDRVAAALFAAFLLRLLAQPRPAQPYATMERALAYIEANLSAPLPLPAVCQACGVSLSTLKHRFKECTGATPRDYINSAKVRQAQAMLAAGSGVTDVAMALGFGSPGYFSVVFRKYTTLTPSQYLQQTAVTTATALRQNSPEKL